MVLELQQQVLLLLSSSQRRATVENGNNLHETSFELKRNFKDWYCGNTLTNMTYEVIILSVKNY